MKKQFHLVDESGDWTSPTDFTYLTSRYAPLSVRVVESVTKDYRQRMKILEQTPGALRKYGFEEEDVARSAGSNRRKRYVVCFLGGITYAEISALRWLANTGESTDLKFSSFFATYYVGTLFQVTLILQYSALMYATEKK
jgi:hypothetical protein